MLLGFAVAPLLPAMVGVAAALFVVAAEIWSIAAGMTWVYTISRSRGGLGRGGRIVMGSICAFIFPIATLLSIARLVHQNGEYAWQEDALYSLLVSLPRILAGAVGGWIFWRISVRPAMPENPAVFD